MKKLNEGSCVMVMGEAPFDKKLQFDGEQTPFYGSRPYLVLGQDGEKIIVLVEKEEIGLGVEELCLVFRNAYVL